MNKPVADAWDSGHAYEQYVGRWSRQVATEFLRWLAPAPLEQVGLKSVTVRAIEIPTVFQDFDDYWGPFLGRTGAAPSYLASAGVDVQERIRGYLKSRLASTRGGPIELSARAWGVQGFA
jgi:hypothetical protein